MEIMGRIIYYFLCGLAGVICASLDISLKSWKYWAILVSVVGSYLCGKYL